jgi:methionine synthase I (cobalamin-dependent)
MNRCIKEKRKAKRFILGCVGLTALFAVIAVSNMTYEDEVAYEEYRAQMEQLWEDSDGQYGWPRQTQ